MGLATDLDTLRREMQSPLDLFFRARISNWTVEKYLWFDSDRMGESTPIAVELRHATMLEF